MINNRIAVIDLGSNTFHLLICSLDDQGKWHELYRERQYVKLAADGLITISPARIQKAISVMQSFASTIQSWGVQTVRAIGTAALREATNGESITRMIRDECGIPVEIIDGLKEADFIRKGIQAGMPELTQPILVMDIGGGSVEFILYQQANVYYQESFKIGVAVLYNQFHKSNPIEEAEQLMLRSFLEQTLSNLTQAVSKHHPIILAGASGSFEVILDALPILERGKGWAKMDTSKLEEHLSGIIHTTTLERRQNKLIPTERVDYVVVAYLLIQYIWKTYSPESLYYCEYALKEGVVSEMVNNFR